MAREPAKCIFKLWLEETENQIFRFGLFLNFVMEKLDPFNMVCCHIGTIRLLYWHVTCIDWNIDWSNETKGYIIVQNAIKIRQPRFPCFENV